jgi:hypothetical protein
MAVIRGNGVSSGFLRAAFPEPSAARTFGEAPPATDPGDDGGRAMLGRGHAESVGSAGIGRRSSRRRASRRPRRSGGGGPRMGGCGPRRGAARSCAAPSGRWCSTATPATGRRSRTPAGSRRRARPGGSCGRRSGPTEVSAPAPNPRGERACRPALDPGGDESLNVDAGRLSARWYVEFSPDRMRLPPRLTGVGSLRGPADGALTPGRAQRAPTDRGRGERGCAGWVVGGGADAAGWGLRPATARRGGARGDRRVRPGSLVRGEGRRRPCLGGFRAGPCPPTRAGR